MTRSAVEDYACSAGYVSDLDAVRAVWSGPGLVETAGSFVLLTYLSLPVLTAVRAPGAARARPVLDGVGERTFLLRLLGLSPESGWAGGLANRRVRRMAADLARGHGDFPGMRREYMDVVAALVALSPLFVQARDRLPAGADVHRYWRYMTSAMGAVDARLGGRGEAEHLCRAFCEEHAAPSPRGEEMLAQFAGRHPRYVAAAVPLLFAKPGAVVGAALGDVHG